ncbi:MAG: hypothetical protein SPL35_04900 [Bacteroidales bacterium]|nr:hypothetical protein [Bacteroidales bacterium]
MFLIRDSLVESPLRQQCTQKRQIRLLAGHDETGSACYQRTTPYGVYVLQHENHPSARQIANIAYPLCQRGAIRHFSHRHQQTLLSIDDAFRKQIPRFQVVRELNTLSGIKKEKEYVLPINKCFTI